MKQSTSAFVVSIALTILPFLSAQDGITGVRYRTVPAGAMNDYIEGERGFWKPAHIEAAKGGALHYWAVLVRAAPYGPELPHQAMTINITNGDYGMQSVVPKMREDKAINKLWQKTNESSRLHHGQMWQLVEKAWGDDGDIGEDDEVFAVVSYMKTRPGRASTYRELEREWQKIHAEAVKAGAMRGWQADRVRFPGGADADYNFVTINYHNGRGFMTSRIGPKYFEKSHPGKNWDAFIQSTGDARVNVRRELYRVAVDLRP